MKNTNSNTLWDSLQKKSHNIEINMDSLERKRTGSYYTDMELTDIMMHELVSNLIMVGKPIYEYRYLEPCVGAGNFVFSYLKAVKALGIESDKAKILLNNIYVVDINEVALQGYSDSLKEIARLYWNIELENAYFEEHIGTGLLVDITASILKYIPIDEVFKQEVLKNGFDIVVTNPPHKNLKAERGHYSNDEEYEIDKGKYTSISKIVDKKFKYSIDGILNLYKLFVEEIVDRYANHNAFISLLLPTSILSDKTCIKLRTHILKDMNLLSVKMMGEGSSYIDAKQALSAILIHKGEKTSTVNIVKDFCKYPEDFANIHIDDILNDNTGNSIFAITEEEYKELRKLRQFPVVKDLDFIINLRGELDLTANKKHIISENSGFPLLRGRNIGYYSLNDTEENEFVDTEFIKATKKCCYIEKERIICQQIANMHKERRVTFALAPKNYVLGNSCNFISINDNMYGIDIYALLGLFNTKIINWLFKLTSSNNHINNYEIDCFPVPVNSACLKKISLLTRTFLESKDNILIDEIEQLARAAYGLDENVEEKNRDKKVNTYLEDIHYIIPAIDYGMAEKILKGKRSIFEYMEGLNKFERNVAKGITDKYISLFNGFILNHTTFKLSDLDLEMIRSIPAGGSWKDIPMETVEKSKRLKRITQTGGRTTLYGRIDYNKPSYTITTYFNRPGNGTYVHPIHQRVLSVREAARFQAFRDDYYFFGNKTQHLKQVGNAVPTLLAYQIARKIKKKTGCCKAIDLFCGAGGMTVGFKEAGIISLLSNDIEESACITLKINNPEIPVLCGDITQSNIKDIIETVAKKGKADIICGGPPCQGFSMAGFRSDNDLRNQLFKEFVDIVKRVNPKVIVFENVEGLLSYQGGKTYREVHTLFSELGYNTEGRTLIATYYAVPQKRKRVIIICTRNDLSILPSDLFPEPITVTEEEQVTARETIFDLENVECSEKAKYTETPKSDILKFFKGEISYEEFVSGRITKRSFSNEAKDFIIGANGQLALNII